jgi:hypothetical protein
MCGAIEEILSIIYSDISKNVYKTDLHDITQILLKVVLSTIHQTFLLISLYIIDNISSIAPHIYIIQL